MIDWHNNRAAKGLFEFLLEDNYLSDYSQDEWSTELIGLSIPPLTDPIVDLETDNTVDRQSLPSSVIYNLI